MLEGAGDLVAAILTNQEQLPEPGCRFDREGRCVWLDGQRVDLTSLEFGTLARFVDQAGHVVSRDELLDTVWKQAYSGSNVVDAVVRSLRKKLGRFAASVGRPWWATAIDSSGFGGSESSGSGLSEPSPVRGLSRLARQGLVYGLVAT